MKATVTTSTAPNVSASDVARSLGKSLVLCLMFLLQSMAKAFGLAQHATLCVCQWLNTRHNFTDQEDPLIMTGWQYLGFGVVVMFVAMVISIKW